MKTLLGLTLVGFLALFAGACSSAHNTPAGAPTAATPAQNADHAAQDQDTPANVRAAFPDAQTFTKQHKDIPPAQKTTIEKESGGAVTETDHHSYLAFTSAGGARQQIGAATVLSVGNDIQLVVVYENRNGSPVIKEVRTDAAVPVFLNQFKGKGHDDKLTLGGSIKAQGEDKAVAKLIISAVAVDVQTMQALYGAAHTH